MGASRRGRVRLRETGKRRWMYLDGKGGETYLLIRAAVYDDCDRVAAGIVEDNAGGWEAEGAPLDSAVRTTRRNRKREARDA